MPFYKITDSDSNDATYVFANTLRRVLYHLSNLDSIYQSYDSIESTSDVQLERTYRKGYKNSIGITVKVVEVPGVPVFNIENGLSEITPFNIPRKELKNSVWKNFIKDKKTIL